MISITITHTNGETTAYRFALAEGVRYRIGRDASCEISLPGEEYLSRVHCFIQYSNWQLMIQDNQSSNGVFLGEQRITSDFLVMDQPYRIGYCYMTVREDDTPAESEVPYQTSSAYGAPYPPSAAYSAPTQAYPAPQPFPSSAAYPVPQAYPPSTGYPQAEAYPASQTYPQPTAYPSAETYSAPQTYPQPVAYPQPETYSVPQGAYPQSSPYPTVETYPAPQAYQQPATYPRTEAYPTPQTYPHPQPASYPQAGAYPAPQAYPLPSAYPQAVTYPAPTSYPQAYPTQPTYPQVSDYPQVNNQPATYPQQGSYVMPELQTYPQPELAVAPEPQSYPQPEPAIAPELQSYPQPEPAVAPEPQSYPQPEPAVAPEPQSYPQPESAVAPEPQSYPQPEPDVVAPEQGAGEKSEPEAPVASMEEMLANELAAEEKGALREKLSGIFAAGKDMLCHWGFGRNKKKKLAKEEENPPLADPPQATPEAKPSEETPRSPEPVEVESAPETEPVPVPVPGDEPVSGLQPVSETEPEKTVERPSPPHVASASSRKKSDTAAANGKKKAPALVRKKTSKKVSTPELQVQGLPGNLFDLPTDFMVHLRVTTSAPRFEEGAPLRFCVKADCDCRVYIVAHDDQGGVELILPGEDGTDNMVFPAVEARFPNVGRTEYQMVVEPPFGTETIVLLAVATTHKCDFAKELRETLKQSSPDQRPGQIENQAILSFREKHAKNATLSKLHWSSSVLSLSTVPKQDNPHPAPGKNAPMGRY